MTIDEIRTQIDQIDSDLLEIFNRRASLALAIGHLKKETGKAIYDPEREKRIFQRMTDGNPGPLDNEAIIRLFERVIDESRSLERAKSKGA